MSKEIKSVLIVCRERPTDDFDVYYSIGLNGVTKIIDSCFSPEPYCEIPRYEVFKDEEIIATVIKPDEVTYLRKDK